MRLNHFSCFGPVLMVLSYKDYSPFLSRFADCFLHCPMYIGKFGKTENVKVFTAGFAWNWCFI